MLSLIRACKPKLPIKADVVVTLRSLASVALDDQAERFPVSNPSAKIRSAIAVALEVDVRVEVGVLVCVGVAVCVCEGVAVGV